MTQKRHASFGAVLIVPVLLFSLWGWWNWQHIPDQLEPTLQNRWAEVHAYLPGASAKELDHNVVRPLEDTLRNINGLDEVEVISSEGSVVAYILLNSKVRHLPTVDNLIRTQLEVLKQKLSLSVFGLQGPFYTRSQNVFFDILVQVKAKEGTSLESTELLSESKILRDALVTDAKIDHVDIIGKTKKRVVVEYRDKELDDAGVHPLTLKNFLSEQNTIYQGGYFKIDNQVKSIQVDSRIRSIEELKSLSILDPSSGDVANIDDVTSIHVETDELNSELVISKGEQAMVLGIRRTKGQSCREMSDAVNRVLDQHSSKLQTSIIVDNRDILQEQMSSVYKGILISFAIVCLMVTLFMGVRMGMVIASMLILVMFSSVALAYIGGLSMNIVSLTSMILVLSLIIDNHIIVGESTDPKFSSTFSMRRLAGTLATASGTTMASFLPIYMSDHVSGEYLKDMVLILLISLAVSFIYSCLITPHFSRLTHAKDAQFVNLISNLYQKFIGKAHPLKWMLLAASFLIFYGAWTKFQTMNEEFFPSLKRQNLVVDLVFSQPQTTDAMKLWLGNFENKVKELELNDYELSSFIGQTLPPISASMPDSVRDPRRMNIVFSNLKKSDDKIKVQNFINTLRYEQKELSMHLSHLSIGPQPDAPLQLILNGSLPTLAKVHDQLLPKLKANNDLQTMDFSWGSPVERYDIKLDTEKASEEGITKRDLALATNLSLNQGIVVTQIQSGSEKIPVVMRAEPSKDEGLEKVNNIYVFPAKGDPVLLYEIADIKTSSESPIIQRKNGQYEARISLYPRDGVSLNALYNQVSKDIQPWSDNNKGVQVNLSMLSKNAIEAKQQLFQFLPLALFLIFLLLSLRTMSFRKTLLILWTIPFGLSGAVFGLSLLGLPKGFMALVGMISLVGLVINNAILLLDEDEHDLNPNDSPWLFVAARRRIRPILMTASSTICGLLPLYFFGGAMWQSLSVTLIFGIAASTIAILSLPIVGLTLFPSKINKPVLSKMEPQV